MWFKKIFEDQKNFLDPLTGLLTDLLTGLVTLLRILPSKWTSKSTSRESFQPVVSGLKTPRFEHWLTAILRPFATMNFSCLSEKFISRTLIKGPTNSNFKTILAKYSTKKIFKVLTVHPLWNLNESFMNHSSKKFEKYFEVKFNVKKNSKKFYSQIQCKKSSKFFYGQILHKSLCRGRFSPVVTKWSKEHVVLNCLKTFSAHQIGPKKF